MPSFIFPNSVKCHLPKYLFILLLLRGLGKGIWYGRLDSPYFTDAW